MIICPSMIQRERILGNIAFSSRERPSAVCGDREPEVHQKGMYIVSPFVFLLERKTCSILYHSVTLKKIYGDQRLAEIFKEGTSGLPRSLSDFGAIIRKDEKSADLRELGILVDNGFLIKDTSDPLLPLTDIRENHLFKRAHIGLLYLLISSRCNLRCRYCTVESPGRKPSNFTHRFMNTTMARKGIDLFLRLIDRNAHTLRVIYYGGEPLLNWNTLLDSLGYLRDRQKTPGDLSMDISITTNGTLITEEIAQAMKDYSLSACVSIDGLKHHHDPMRPYTDGHGSWEDALRGYFLVKSHTGSCGIACTMGPHNYRDLEEIAEFFAARLECRNMMFNFIRGLPAGTSLEVPVAEISEQLIKAYRIFRRYGIYESRMMRMVNSFVYEIPHIYDCGAGGSQIAITAEGFAGPCHIAADDHRFCWGHMEERDLRQTILEGELTEAWCHRSPVMREQCMKCIGLGICGGGCAEEAYMKSGDPYEMDRQRCIHNRHLIEWMCDDLAGKLKESGEL